MIGVAAFGMEAGEEVAAEEEAAAAALVVGDMAGTAATWDIRKCVTTSEIHQTSN